MPIKKSELLATLNLVESDIRELSGLKFKVTKNSGFIQFNLYAEAGGLTDEEKGWTVSPETIKANQIGRIELDQRYLEIDRVLSGFDQDLNQFKSKSTPSRRNPEFSNVMSVAGVVIGAKFRGKGYGLALFLKALEYSTQKGYWLTSDYKYSDSGDALATWKNVFKFSQKSFVGKYNKTKLPPYSQPEPFMAAFGLNSAGVEVLKKISAE